MSFAASIDVNDLKLIFLSLMVVVGLYILYKTERSTGNTVSTKTSRGNSVSTKTSKGNYEVNINGVKYTGKGNNVSVIKNKIYVDGVEITKDK